LILSKQEQKSKLFFCLTLLQGRAIDENDISINDNFAFACFPFWGMFGWPYAL